MAAYQYELVKCEGCGKTLGYIRVTVRTRPPPITPRYWFLSDRSPPRIEKTAFCEECFLQGKTGISKRKSDERVESQRKPRHKRMVR